MFHYLVLALVFLLLILASLVLAEYLVGESSSSMDRNRLERLLWHCTSSAANKSLVEFAPTLTQSTPSIQHGQQG
jgi:hypothetical protein